MPVLKTPMNKNILCFSALCVAGFLFSASAQAELEINPYPSKPSPQSQSKAAPLDFLTGAAPPPLRLSDPEPESELEPAHTIEEHFEDLDNLVEKMAVRHEDVDPEAIAWGGAIPKVAPALVTAPTGELPVLRLKDLHGGAPQSGLYYVGKVMEEPFAPVLVAAPAHAALESGALSSPVFTPLYASTARPSEALFEEPVSFVPVMEDVVIPQEEAFVVARDVNEHWNSFAGANLHETLDVWSKAAGVDLIWSFHNSDFEVHETLTLDTTYEAAVQALLEQYDGVRIRPVGRLHVDQASGARTLLIEIVDER